MQMRDAMDPMNIRLWIFFYLISFVAVLWATFLLIQGVMLWVSLTLVTVVTGFNFIVILGEIRSHSRRKKALEQLIRSCGVMEGKGNEQSRRD
jgi:Flp pilus assembly protein TadB